MELAVRDGGRWLGRSWLGRLALAACLAAPWAAATVAPLAVAPAVAVAQDEGESEGDGKSTAEEKSYLVFLAEALGIKYIIIFLLLINTEKKLGKKWWARLGASTPYPTVWSATRRRPSSRRRF